jgi:endoglucanase
VTPCTRAVVLAGLAIFAGACGPADETLLASTWSGYRNRFIAADGRVIRPEHGNDTVSEGQAYALLRAAWMDDRTTFDRVWHWTRSHLNRDGGAAPALLAWRWTEEAGVADANVASDADADVALALLVAAGKWPDAAPAYRAAASAMLTDLGQHLIALDEQERPVFLPGTWADQRAEGRGLVLNPSYLSPASFRAFHHATGNPRWLDLADGAYDVLEATCGEAGATMAPDWIRWWSSERWTIEQRSEGSAGWDAVRVPWRVATDWLWFQNPRARAYLDRCVQPIVRRRLEAGLGVSVEPGGQESASADAAEHPLANALFSFSLEAPVERDRLLARVLPQVVADGSGAFFAERDRYYVNSLAYLPFLARAGRYTAP